MADIEYPMEQVLEIKRKRVEDAEREVRAKEEELDKEKEILAQKEAERDKVLNHRDAKLAQLRKVLDEGTTSREVQMMKAYLKVVKERLVAEEKKVSDQEEQVEVAKTNLKIAQQELKNRRREVDKLEKHKEEWVKDARKELEREEAREQDDMGNIIFSRQLRARDQ